MAMAIVAGLVIALSFSRSINRKLGGEPDDARGVISTSTHGCGRETWIA